jgi:hypothetical protein
MIATIMLVLIFISAVLALIPRRLMTTLVWLAVFFVLINILFIVMGYWELALLQGAFELLLLFIIIKKIGTEHETGESHHIFSWYWISAAFFVLAFMMISISAFTMVPAAVGLRTGITAREEASSWDLYRLVLATLFFAAMLGAASILRKKGRK